MANARPLYLSSGRQTQLQESDVLNANALEVFGTVPSSILNLFNTSGSYAVNLVTGTTGNVTIASSSTGTVGIAAAAGTVAIGAASTVLTLGGAATEVGIPGNLTVDGDENVIGTTTFEGDTIIGQGGDDTLTIDADVNSDIDFDNGASRTIRMLTGAASNLTMTNAGTGALTLSTSSGALNVTSGGALDMDGTVVNLDGSTSIGIGTTTDVPVTLEASTFDVTTSDDINITTAGTTGFVVDATDAAGGFYLSGVASSNLSLSGASSVLTLASSGVSGQVVINATGATAGTVDINAGAGGAHIDAAGASNLTTSSGNLTLASAAVLNMDGASVTLDSSTTNVAITANTTVDLVSTGANAITMTSGSSFVDLSTSGANKSIELTVDSGGTPKTAGIYVGSGSPDTVVTGEKGSLYMDVTNGAVYVNSNGTTGWAALTTGGSLTLQDVYNNSTDPATITTTATKELIFEDNNNDDFFYADPVNHRVDLGATGGTNNNDVRLLGEVASNITFENTTARIIGIDSQALTVRTTTSGALTLTSAAAATWSTTAGALSITGAGGLNLTGTNNTVAISSGTAATTVASGGASSWANDSGDLTLSTATSGDLVLTSVAAVDVNAGTTVSVDGTGISVDGTAASNFSVTGANLTLSTIADTGVSGGNVVIDAVRDTGTGGAIQMTADAASSWTVDSGALTLTTTTSGAIVANSVDQVRLTGQSASTPASGSWLVTDGEDLSLITNTTGVVHVYGVDGVEIGSATGTSVTMYTDGTNTVLGHDAANTVPDTEYSVNLKALSTAVAADEGKILLLQNNQTSPAEAGIQVYSGDPSAVLDANQAGDICLSNDGNLYVATAAGTANWEAVGLASALSLQGAYDGGATITTAGAVPIDFTLSGGGFNVSTSSGNNITFDNGSTAFLTVNGTSGAVTLNSIASTLLLSTNTSGNVNIIPASNGTVNVTTSGTGAIQMASDANSYFNVTTGTLLLSTVTSGDLSVTSAGILYLTGASGFDLDGSAASTINVNNDSLAIQTTTAGQITVTPASGSNFTVQTAGAGDISLYTANTVAGGAINIGSNGNESPITVRSDSLYMSAITSATLTSSGSNVSLTAPAAAVNITAASDSAFSFGGGGLTVTASAVNGNLTLTAGTSGGDVILNAGTLAGGVADINGYTVDIDSGAGGVSITSADGDIALTATSVGTNDILFQAHGGTVVEFNDATYTDLDSFPASYQTICGALEYLLGEIGGGLVANYVIATGITIVAGDALYIDTDGKVNLADSDADASSKFIGIAKSGGTGDGSATADVYVGGEVTTTAILGTTPDEGDYVYLSGTAGDITVDAPGTGTVLRVGVITNAASNKILIQVGEPVSL